MGLGSETPGGMKVPAPATGVYRNPDGSAPGSRRSTSSLKGPRMATSHVIAPAQNQMSIAATCRIAIWRRTLTRRWRQRVQVYCLRGNSGPRLDPRDEPFEQLPDPRQPNLQGSVDIHTRRYGIAWKRATRTHFWKSINAPPDIILTRVSLRARNNLKSNPWRSRGPQSAQSYAHDVVFRFATSLSSPKARTGRIDVDRVRRYSIWSLYPRNAAFHCSTSLHQAESPTSPRYTVRGRHPWPRDPGRTGAGERGKFHRCGGRHGETSQAAMDSRAISPLAGSPGRCDRHNLPEARVRPATGTCPAQ